MKDDTKRKFQTAFDEGKLDEVLNQSADELDADPGLASYARNLRHIEFALTEAPEMAVPSGFVQTILSRLPVTHVGRFKTFQARDILIASLVFFTFIMSFVFADFLGIGGAMDNISNVLTAQEESGSQILFILISGVGILLSSWLIVSSFFGIRTRRISR